MKLSVKKDKLTSNFKSEDRSINKERTNNVKSERDRERGGNERMMIPMADLLHIFNKQTNKKQKNKQIYKKQTKKKSKILTNNNKQIYKNKKSNK